MKTINKYFVYGLCLAGLLFTGNLRGQNSCYTPLMAQGLAAKDTADYELAIRSFQSILRNCRRLTEEQRKKAIDLTAEVFELQKEAIKLAEQKLAEEKVQAAQVKEQNANQVAVLNKKEFLTSESNRVSFFSSVETNAADKLSLAFLSKQLIEDTDIASPAVSMAFGDAVRENYVDIQRSQDGYINDVLITGDFRIIYSINHSLSVKKAEKDSAIVEISNAHNDHILSITSFTDGFITTSKDHTAKIWNKEGKAIYTLEGHRDDVNFAKVSADETLILTGSRDSTAILWNAEGKLLHVLQGHKGTIYDGLLSHNGQLILTRSGDKTVKLWDRNGDNITTLRHDAYLYDMLIMPESQQIITCSADRTIKIWSKNGQLQNTLQKHEGSVFDLQLSPDKKYFLSTSTDNSSILWKADGKLVRRFQSAYATLPPEDAPKDLAPIRKAVFSPNGNDILTTYGNKMQLIDYEGNVIVNFQHEAAVTELVFSPNGKYLLSGAQDNTAKLWDLKGNILLNLNPFMDHIIGLDFSTEGNHALAYSKDGTLAFCPTPDYIYALLEEKTPEVSEELKIKYNLQDSDDNGN